MTANGRLELTRRLTLNHLTWKIWWVPNNASKCHIVINSSFEGLNLERLFEYFVETIRLKWAKQDTISFSKVCGHWSFIYDFGCHLWI